MEPLVEIVERIGHMPSVVKVKDRGTYYSPTKAATLLGMSRSTMNNWIHKGYFKDTFEFPLSSRLYLNATEVEQMATPTKTD